MAAPCPLRIVRASPNDLPFIEQLGRRDARFLGFLPRAALAEKIRLGFVRLAVLCNPPPAPMPQDRSISGSFGRTADPPISGSFGTASAARAAVGGRPVGFLLHGSLRRPEVRIFQLAVEASYRRMGIARLLLADLLRHCRQAGIAGVSLRCRGEFAANRFWHRSGFKLHALEEGRGGALYVWVRRVKGLAQNRPTEPLGSLQNKPTETPFAIQNRPTEVPLPVQNKPTDGPVPAQSRPTEAPAAAQNKPTAAPQPAIRDDFRFHSRWRRCRGCRRWTCGSWSAAGKRRATCGRCEPEPDVEK